MRLFIRYFIYLKDVFSSKSITIILLEDNDFITLDVIFLRQGILVGRAMS